MATFASALFAGGNDKHSTGRSGKLGRELHKSGNESRYAAFHVRAAAPVDFAVRDLRAEGLDCPRCRAKRDNIGVPGEGDGTLAPSAADARDQVFPVGTNFII